jgi:hypothetical protein
MASKSDILKRIQASEKGEPTFQDTNRLKTWKKAGQGSRDQKHGYERALRNMQRSAQQGQAFNKVDAQIVSSYVKETPEQLLSKSKTFMNLAMWLPAGGAAAKLGATALKAASKLAAPTAKGTTAAAKKAAEAAAKKAAAKKAAEAAAPKVAKVSDAAAKKALKTAQRKAQRARLKARTDVLGDIAKGGVQTKGLAQAANKAGKQAYNKVMKQHAKDVAPKVAKVVPRGPVSRPPGRIKKVASEVIGRTTKGRRSGKALRTKTGQLHGLKPKDIRLAKGIRTGTAAVAIPAAAVGTALALKEDKKPEKKTVTPPSPRRKPTGSEVYFERARRDREDAAKARRAGEATAKARRAGEATAKARRAGEIGLFEQIKKKKDRKITKATAKGKLVNVGADPDVSGLYEHWEYPDLMSSSVRKKMKGLLPWNWKQISGPRDPSGAFDKKAFAKKGYETGIPFLKNISVEPPDEDDEFVGMNKKGGQIKKSIKKAKAKPRKAKAKTRKRAALRGHRAELRGG